MWAPHQTPAPIEKVRKAQWTDENTRATQEVVDVLEKLHDWLNLLGVSWAVNAVRLAMKRLQALDPKVKLPW